MESIAILMNIILKQNDVIFVPMRFVFSSWVWMLSVFCTSELFILHLLWFSSKKWDTPLGTIHKWCQPLFDHFNPLPPQTIKLCAPYIDASHNKPLTSNNYTSICDEHNVLMLLNINISPFSSCYHMCHKVFGNWFL